MSAGCAGAVFDTADGSLGLAATDPSIVADAATIIFSFSTTKACKDLVDLGPGDLATELAPEAAPLQTEPAHSKDAQAHVFGRVPPDKAIAYFVLASSRANAPERVGFADFKGTVFAMACRDFTAGSGTRHDLPLTLFPIGLR
jgi:hypothetical protein